MYPLHQRLHDETARKGIPKITSCGRDNLALRGTNNLRDREEKHKPLAKSFQEKGEEII